MSDQTFTKSRRNFLKGAAYTSALSVGGLSSVALAADAVTGASKTADKETVVLFNQSAKTVKLDVAKPVSLELLNGWAVVKINKQLEINKPAINLEPGERQSFAVDAVLAPMLSTTGNYIVITSEFTALNNIVPISTVDVAVA